ncbi:MAG: molybdopterin-binding protein [Thermoplasmata archaeon]
MRRVKTDRSEGLRLAYDTTIVTPKISRTLLPKGHVIRREDVPRLKDSGVFEVWVEDGGDEVREDEISAGVAKRISGENVLIKRGKHGMCTLVAAKPGVITISRGSLRKINEKGSAMVILRRNGTAVSRGEIVGVVDSIPLSLKRRELNSLLSSCEIVVTVKEFKRRRVGLIVTGTEIFEGRKRDSYRRVIRDKCSRYGWEIIFSRVARDDEDDIKDAMEEAIRNGAEGVIVTGGMSVDATDRTPSAIVSAGAKIIAYGIPVKPTTMTIVAVLRGVPVLGISAGGIHYRKLNSVDMIFTRMMADMVPTRREIADLGDGGITDYYLSSHHPREPSH